MRRLPFIIIVLLTAGFFAFKSSLANKNDPPTKQEMIMRLVGQLLAQGHYSPQNFDDSFSQKVFNQYIDELDPQKNVFLQADYDSLFERYGSRIDDELQGAPLLTCQAVTNVFNMRNRLSDKWTKEILAKPFDYTLQDSVILDGEKLSFAKTEEERKERVYKKIKYYALDRYVALLDERKANQKTPGYVVKTDEQLEKEARAKTDTLLTRAADRMMAKFNSGDNFDIYVRVITNTMDPHTEFMAPLDKRYFDEEISGSFYGIGAILQQTEGQIKIADVTTGGPAQKSGEIQKGDIIAKVAQGEDGPDEELIGYNIQDAVKLIRGKEGSVVRLTIKKPEGTLKVVRIVREKIESDLETYARSAIIADEKKKTKIGIILLPEFYTSFGDPNGRRSYMDVAEEVKKLKQQNVDGIVLDLRNNGGGSLMDVVKMVGLFVGKGPVVQVKDRNNKPTVLQDDDDQVLYTGPLAVMVNEFSASASEIFAAAIQDYGRGIIIGSSSTFGKGTVQRNIGLDSKTGYTDEVNPELGSVKLTIQKFYRINGGSTQLKGVASDIQLPSQYDYLKIREKDLKDVLPYDEIKKADFKTWNSLVDLSQLKKLSKSRIEKDTVFNIIRQNSVWLAAQNERSYPLNIDAFRKDRATLKAKADQIDSVQKLRTLMNVSLIPGEENKFANDKGKEERVKLWINSMRKDIYLNQAVDVVDDMLAMTGVAKNKQNGL